MKKFLTVLLVIAVMFTFSFSSAFATVNYVAKDAAGNILYGTTDVSTNAGEYGITGVEKAAVISAIKASMTDTVLSNVNGYFAKENAAAKEILANAVKDAEAATTAKALHQVVTDTNAALKKLTDAVTAAKAAIASETNTYVSVDRLVDRYAGTAGFNGDFFLEGYTYFTSGTDTAVSGTDYYLAVAGTKDALSALAAPTKKVEKYFLDNQYQKAYQMADGVSALVGALKPVTTAYIEALAAEKNAIQDKIWAYADKYSASARENKLTTADLDGMYAVKEEALAFTAKMASQTVGTVNGAFDVTDFNTAWEALADEYFEQFDAECKAVPEVAKLTDADKATVIALNKKINAAFKEFNDKYEDMGFDGLGNAVDGANALITDYSYLTKAYDYFLDADKTAYGKLDAFTAYVANASGTGNYFDNEEKNVKAVEAARAAYDEFVANYGYTNVPTAALGETTVLAQEAKLVAAEHNKTLAKGYDDKKEAIDTAAIKALLNNATVKVTTKALGQGRVRVQATIDSVSFQNILANLAAGNYEVKYQFFKGKAGAKELKGYSVRNVNYTTFKCKKGTKYDFQCAVKVVVDGETIATKDYKASTVGTRTAK